MRESPFVRRSWYLLAAALVAGGCGLGSDPYGDRETVYPVTGRVTVDGQPAAQARLAFTPVDRPDGSQFECETITAPDGTFACTSYPDSEGDGLPSGTYEVRIVWPNEINRSAPEYETDRLMGRYNDPANPAFRVTVVDSPVAVEPYDLTTTRRRQTGRK